MRTWITATVFLLLLLLLPGAAEAQIRVSFGSTACTQVTPHGNQVRVPLYLFADANTGTVNILAVAFSVHVTPPEYLAARPDGRLHVRFDEPDDTPRHTVRAVFTGGTTTGGHGFIAYTAGRNSTTHPELGASPGMHTGDVFMKINDTVTDGTMVTLRLGDDLRPVTVLTTNGVMTQDDGITVEPGCVIIRRSGGGQ